MTFKYIKNIKQQTPIDIIIPAAGLGRRMKSYGPKSLIKIKKNLTVIDHQLKIIKNTIPNANIILVSGFESDYLMNNTPNDIIKVENERYEQTNVVRSIGLGLRASQRDVLIIYGDLVFNSECIENINFNRSSILIGDNMMKESEVGCIFNNSDKLESMMYDLEHKWSQMIFLKGKELEIFKKICWNTDNYSMFGFEAINDLLSMGGIVNVCHHKDAKAIDIDSSKDLEKVSQIL